MKKFITFIAKKISYIIRSVTEPLKEMFPFDHRWDSYLKFLNRRGIFFIILLLAGYLYYNRIESKVPQALKMDELGYENEEVIERIGYKNSLGTSIYKLNLTGVEPETLQSLHLEIMFYEFSDESFALDSLLEELNAAYAKNHKSGKISWETVDLYFVQLDPKEWNSDLAYSQYNLVGETRENTLFIQKNNRLLILELTGLIDYCEENRNVLKQLIDFDYSFIK